MSKNPTPERTLYLDIKKSEDSKLTTDPIERQEHLRECFEAEEQTILFDENRADEVLYYQKKTVEAKTLPELEKVEKLILNRVTLLNEVPELKATRKKLKDVLKYLEAEKREKAQNARTFEKPENSFADYLKHSDIAYISESLGHSDLKTTENYLASFEQSERAKNAKLLTNFESHE